MWGGSAVQRLRVWWVKKRRLAAGWYGPADPTPMHQCPCCDYVTLPERGNYLICPVCFWEDDGTDLDALDEPSEANHGITLRLGRANFKQFGACEETMVENVVPVAERGRFEHRPRDIA